ncbi:calcium-binding protein [Chloroflexota bacterium]
MTFRIFGLCLAFVFISLLLAACVDGENTPTLEELEESSILFVQNATSGTLTPVEEDEDTFLLTLEGVSHSTIWFADRPGIRAGHETTRMFINNWGTGQDSFAALPPNAALDILEGEQDGDVLVVQISQPEYDEEAGRLTYQAKILSNVTRGLEVFNLRIDKPEAMPRSFGHASLFIDSYKELSQEASILGATTDDGSSGTTITPKILDNDPMPALAGKIVINEIGVNSGLDGKSFIEILSVVDYASDTTPSRMSQLSLFIVGQDGQVIRINQGFINKTLPALGPIIIYEDGTLEIRNKDGAIQNIGADANWMYNAQIYIDGEWKDYDPAIHNFAFGDTTSDPLLVNLQQSDSSIDYFTANSPVANTAQDKLFNGTWYPPDGTPASKGDFTSFDGSLTNDIVFARVLIDVGYELSVVESGGIDSDTAVDWTTNSEPTIFGGRLNPTQDGTTGDLDGQTIVFGTEGADTIDGAGGPDILYGRGGDDTILGGDGNDLLSGGAGDDLLSGGAGDDLIIDADFSTSGGTNVINGGEGVDTFKFTTAADTVSLDLTYSDGVDARLSGVEILDMSDMQAGDSLTITKYTVNALGENNHTSSITPDSISEDFAGTVDIYVRGDGANDLVNLQGESWYPEAVASIVWGSEIFNIWIAETIEGAAAVIAIQEGVTVNTN